MVKTSELRDQRAKHYDEAREIGERANTEKREFTADERTRMDEILKLMDTMAQDISRLERLEAHSRDASEAEWKASLKRISEPLPHEDPESKHKYSLCRAILRSADGQLDGLEGECHQEISKRIGKKSAGPLGFFMPTNLRMRTDLHPNYRVGGRPVKAMGRVEQRIDDTTAGAGAVLTRWDTTWIEFLRSKMVLNQLGPRVFTDMHGNFQMPLQTGIGTVSWVAESTAVSTTAQTIGQVLFTPKTVGAFTDMSRRFLEQLSIDPELFVREDLSAILARGIESAAYNGTGAPQPTGIMQLAGITAISEGTNGGPPTWIITCQLEEALGKANALQGNLANVCTPQALATFKQTAKQGTGQTSYYPRMLIDEDRLLNNYQILPTNLLPSNLTKGTGTNLSSLIFGNWSEAMLAFWSGMDVLVDPYTGGAAGTLRIVVLQDVDFEVRHVPSFVILNDMVTA
jgi:HK97 family phage major capsid protein